MKKITLFIAFLAISIGSVWGQAYETLTATGTVTVGGGNLPTNIKISANGFDPSIATSNPDDDYEYFSSFSLTVNSADISSLNNANCSITVTVGSLTPVCFAGISASVTDDKTLTFGLGRNVNFTKNDQLSIDITWPQNKSVAVNDWSQNIIFKGSRKLKYSDSGNKYIVHTGSYTASLEKYAKNSIGNYYISDVLINNSQNVEGDLYSYYQIDGFSYSINNESHDISITALGDTAFNGFQISSNSAFLLPATIKSIGNSNSENMCFMFANSNEKKVLVIFNYSGQGVNSQSDNSGYIVPTFASSDANFNNLVAQKTYLMLGPSASFSYANWQDTPIGKFSDKGKSWYPFQIEVSDMEKMSSTPTASYAGDDPMSGKSYVEIYQYPFDNTNLIVKLTGIEYGSHDGSWCQYYKINKVFSGTDELEGVIADDWKSFTVALTTISKFTAKLKYVNNLVYGRGNPYFNIASDKNKVVNESNNPILCYKSEGVYFRFKDNNDNVPYWKYTNEEYDGGNAMTNPPGSLTIGCPVYVEKVITNKHYRYFSLPFDCNVSDIEVHKIVNNEVQNETIPIMTEKPSSTENWPNDKDYYIINKYVGQSTTSEGLPEYSWIGSGQLDKNNGYAFALSIKDEDVNTDVSALITFKSKDATNQLYLNTYNGLAIPVTYRSDDNNFKIDQNKGWNMIGNPFYHYLKPNSFYGTDPTNDGIVAHPVKYISLINDDANETVSHYWVNEQLYYKGPNGESDREKGQANGSIDWIKPFQAFFVQIGSGTTSIQVYPIEGDAPFSYLLDATQNPEAQSVSRIPAEEEEIQEHLSVKLTGQDGASDRTTIINDESRDEHFKMMDDLAKIMNPGVQIYTWYDSVPCAFKELPMRADSTMAIPLGVRVTEAGNYTFALDTNLTFFYGAAMLHDKQMNQYHPLNEDGVQISLSVLGEVNDRFEVVIIPSEIPADVEDVETSESLDAYVHDGRLVVENIEDGSTLSIFDVSGKMLYTAPAAGDFNYQFSAHGVYMVVLQGNTTGSIKVVY